MKRLVIALHLFILCFTAIQNQAYAGPPSVGQYSPFLPPKPSRFERFFNIEDKVMVLENIQAELKEKYNYKDHTDYALLLMEYGNIKMAFSILNRLNQVHPNEYTILLNLTRAFELKGMLDSAIYYNQKVLSINKMGNLGSEWIHRRMLQTRLALKKDSTLLEKDPFADLDTISNIAKLQTQLSFQLQEQIPYYFQSDKLLAYMLAKLGSLYEKTGEYSEAYIAYKYCMAFHTKETGQPIKKKLKELKGKLSDLSFRDPIFESLPVYDKSAKTPTYRALNFTVM